MCQYVSTCPTREHKPGALCPVEEQRKKREWQVLLRLIALLGLVAVLGFWWVMFPRL